jgi:hypothetical protein
VPKITTHINHQLDNLHVDNSEYIVLLKMISLTSCSSCNGWLFKFIFGYGSCDLFAEMKMTDHRNFVKIAGLQANSITSGFLRMNLFMAVLSSLKTFTT